MQVLPIIYGWPNFSIGRMETPCGDDPNFGTIL